LLANLRFDISIMRMQLPKFPLEDVGVRSGKLRFPEAADDVQYVQRPAALGDGNVFQLFDALELFPHFRFGNDFLFRDDSNPSVSRNAI